MWIIIQFADHTLRKAVCEVVRRVVEDMAGVAEPSSSIDGVVVAAKFPHRRYKTVEKAVAGALRGLPVERTIVVGQDPYIMRPSTLGLTMELYQRQDEVVGRSGVQERK
jgi:hypothetical protein